MLIKAQPKKFFYSPANIAGGAGAVGGGPATLAYKSSASAGSGGPTISYGTIAFTSGTYAVLAILYVPNNPGPTTVSSVSVGGNALVQATGAYAANSPAGIAVDVWVSTGTISGASQAVSVTYGAGTWGTSAVALYSLTTTTPTPAHGANNLTANSTSITQSIVVPTSGVALAASASQGGHVLTFTNATSDVTFVTGSYNFGHLTSTGTVSVTGTPSASDGLVIGLASWGP
jgi:hypothetical protein